ncbi:MAG: riboflavin biosynthesis protein RibF [Phycisphaerales bacterium]|nr:MAG: riboflavin biosynthesis protein RibF [Phycisphaerales bacterium]
MPPLTAITIGNFDGVHVGHIQLVRMARAAVGDEGHVIVLSFDPHPASILHPEQVPQRLSTCEQRSRLLKQVGADEITCLQPTLEFLQQEPEEFLTTTVNPYRPDVIVEGPDFRFGHGRAGTVQTLRSLEARHGFHTVVIDPVEIALSDHSLVRVSSSVIRWLLERGRVRDAARLLGRPYELVGPVIAGDRRGREIGIPTANLDHDDLLLPGDGIYAGTAVLDDGRSCPAAISVGRKPTFGGGERICEAHLLGHDGPLDDYGWTAHLQFHDWIRDQVAFSSVQRLVRQMHRDIARVGALRATAE